MTKKSLYFLLTTFLFSSNIIFSKVDGWNIYTVGDDWIIQLVERDNNLLGWFDLSKTYHSPTSMEISLISGRSGSPNNYAAFEKTYNLDEIIPDGITPSEYYISLSIKDNYTGSDNNYFFKQILVNNTIVWEEDVAENKDNTEDHWMNIDVNISDKIQSDKIVKITLRVYQKQYLKNFEIKTYWDNFIIHFDKNTNRRIRQNRLEGTMATYAGMGPVSFNGDDEGRTDEQDVTELINEILYSNSNTYAFLFYYENDTTNKAHHWELFNERILDSLLKNDLKVWVYLVPPSESGNWKSEPYQTDYERWAMEIAGLSIENEGLTALAIDDFDGNLDGRYTPDFTSSYVENFVNKMHDINPFLAFIPVSYYRKGLLQNQDRLNEYGDNFDAILFPYFINMANAGINNYSNNLWNTTNLKDQIDEIKTNINQIPNLDPKPLLIVDVYASSYYSIKPAPIVSTPEYILEVGQKALNYSDGVCYYLLQRERKTTNKEKRKREAIRTLFSNTNLNNSNDDKRIYVLTPGDQIINTIDSTENFLYSPNWLNTTNINDFSNVKNVLVSDFDGDGFDEIAVFYKDGNLKSHQKILVYKAGTNVNGLPTYNLNFLGSWLNFDKERNELGEYQYILSGDFNGNGRDDIAVFYAQGDDANSNQRVLVYEKHKTQNKFILIKGTESGNSWLNDNFNKSEIIITGDFNGNGQDEIAVLYDFKNYAFSNQKITVYEKHKTQNKFVQIKGDGVEGTWLDKRDNDFGKYKTTLVGDFDGNGIDDIALFYGFKEDGNLKQRVLIYEKDEAQNKFVLKKGTEPSNSWLDLQDDNFNHIRYQAAGDFDGDGIDELSIFYENKDTSVSRQKIFIYKKGNVNKFILTNGSESENSWYNQKLSTMNFDCCLLPLSAQLYDEDDTEVNRNEIILFYDKNLCK